MAEAPSVAVHLVLTPEQVKTAPHEVRAWLYRTFGAADPAPCIVERNGFRTTEDGLAVCDEAEIVAMMDILRDDRIAVQILFQFGCSSYDPETGALHAHRVSVGDLLHYTELGCGSQLDSHLKAVTAALHDVRADDSVRLFDCVSHGTYCVHDVTQVSIHRVYEKLSKARALSMPLTRPSPELAMKKPRDGGGRSTG